MTILQTIAVAFSMFTAIPMPQFEWNEKNMKYSLCAFPLIGVVLGAVMWIVATCLDMATDSILIRGAVLAAVPVLVTGGIHIDGFADTIDAQASHQSKERKLEIMKDPHVGSFAMIYVGTYLIANFALWAEAGRIDIVLMILMFTLSRSMSGLAIASFPLAKNTGLVHTFASEAVKGQARIFLAILTAALLAGMMFLGKRSIAMAAGAVCMFLFYRVFAKKNFGGITGDIAGWFLVLAEFIMLGAYVLIR